MALRPHGRAQVDPTSPRAWATCDRCGFNYNLINLRWQYQWAGINLINLQILVCDICLDKPSDFLKTIVLPPDPPTLYNVRPEPYTIDETNWFVDEQSGDKFVEEGTSDPFVEEWSGHGQLPSVWAADVPINLSATVLTVFAPQVQVIIKDVYANPQAGVSVTFSAGTSTPSPGCTFGGATTVTTDARGVAVCPVITANLYAGQWVLTASATGYVSLDFTMTNVPEGV